MNFNKLAVTINVWKDYGACFDFYTETMGLVPSWGDRASEWTSLSAKEGAPPCIAIFDANLMAKGDKAYGSPKAFTQPDTITLTIPTDDVERDYKRLKEAGVEFIGIPESKEMGSKSVKFRDTEGNLLELGEFENYFTGTDE
ncbi:MAG: VOC family protein [Oscillospiraceae bacterium]|nr:VOC family protein [Oscillospiraceae bacterium]